MKAGWNITRAYLELLMCYGKTEKAVIVFVFSSPVTRSNPTEKKSFVEEKASWKVWSPFILLNKTESIFLLFITLYLECSLMSLFFASASSLRTKIVVGWVAVSELVVACVSYSIYLLGRLPFLPFRHGCGRPLVEESRCVLDVLTGLLDRPWRLAWWRVGLLNAVLSARSARQRRPAMLRW